MMSILREFEEKPSAFSTFFSLFCQDFVCLHHLFRLQNEKRRRGEEKEEGAVNLLLKLFLNENKSSNRFFQEQNARIQVRHNRKSRMISLSLFQSLFLALFLPVISHFVRKCLPGNG